MRKFKAILWGIIILFLALVFFQNRVFFETKTALMLNLYVTDAYQKETYTAIWFLVALVIGFLVAYFFALLDRFKTAKLLKGLKAKTKAQEEMIDQMKREIGHGADRYPDERDDTPDMGAAGPAATEKKEFPPENR